MKLGQLGQLALIGLGLALSVAGAAWVADGPLLPSPPGVAVAIAAPQEAPFNAAQRQQLDALERHLFGEVSHEGPDARLARLERTVFGTASSGPPGPRLTRLANVLPKPATLPSAESNPPTTEVGYTLPPAPPQTLPTQATPATQSPTTYPTVSRMERQRFGHTFERDTLEARLNRLEVSLYGRVQSGSLSDRTDRLASALLPTAPEPQDDPADANGQAAGGPNRPLYRPPDGVYNAPTGRANMPPGPPVTRQGGWGGYPTPPRPPASANAGNLVLPPNATSPVPVAPPQGGQQQPAYTPSSSTSATPPPIVTPSAGGIAPFPENEDGEIDVTDDQMRAALTQLEMRYYKTAYPHLTIAQRISALETTVFQQQSPSGVPDEQRLQRLLIIASTQSTPNAVANMRKMTPFLLPILMLLPLVI